MRVGLQTERTGVLLRETETRALSARTQRGPVSTQMMVPTSQEKRPQKETCWHLDLGFSASRTVRK